MKRTSIEHLAEAVFHALRRPGSEVSDKVREVIEKNFDVVVEDGYPELKRKKIGRPGDKMNQAFEAITEKPVSVEELAKRFGIKPSILSQHRRFDKTGRGKTHIKDGKIYREAIKQEKPES